MAKLRTLRHQSWPIAAMAPWAALAGVLALMPWLFTGGFALKLLTLICIGVIASLSYNMLLGQTGLLSFGHAVYSGLGAFAAIHAMNLIAHGQFSFPLALLPLVGGLTGLFFGATFGFVSTRRGGTAFSMVTLGIGEMVVAISYVFPDLFGGEGGIAGNRTVGPPLFGVSNWNLATDMQVYALTALWCFASVVAMFALTHTPLGRIANAVRDGAERAAFIGYDPRQVRWMMLMLSAFFAGIAGALGALCFEIVSAEQLSAVRSGSVLLATFIGGTAFFFGPMLGAIVFALFSQVLSELTKAWPLYLGVFFVALVMVAPGGMASVLAIHMRVITARRFAALADPYIGLISAMLLVLAGASVLVEMIHHVTLDSALGPTMTLFGLPIDTSRSECWVAAAALLVGGLSAWLPMKRRFVHHWDKVQAELVVLATESQTAEFGNTATGTR